MTPAVRSLRMVVFSVFLLSGFPLCSNQMSCTKLPISGESLAPKQRP
jgi:hypothetical protein